ncbi:ABC transporter ATP-binding protein [Gemmatimonas sp.]|uniref:ABC transporter ATP-binding protein n=1 Tax=Gemmatimonas sp. TaxID=1962908 RepID=UPI00391F0F9D
MAAAPASAHPDDDALGAAYDARLVRRLLRYVRPSRALAAAALGCLGVAAALQLAAPLLTRWVIDVAWPARDRVLVMQVAGGFAALLVLQFAASYGETLFTALLGQRVMRDLRAELFAHVQRLPIAYFDRTPVGRLVTRVTSDVEALNELFTSGVVSGVGDLFTLVAISVVMLVVDWRLAVAAFVVIPLVLLTSRVFQRHVRETYREIRARVAQVNAYLGERLSGMRLIQLFGREHSEAQRFARLNEGHLEAQLRSITVYALYFPVIEFLTTLALASLLVTAAGEVAGHRVTVGTVAAFLQLVRRFFQPLQDLSEKYNILQAAMAASERLFGLLDTPGTAGHAPSTDREARVRAMASRGVTVQFEHVWFAYGPATPAVDPAAELAGGPETGGSVPWVLRDVSFTVGPGQSLALVGHTGAGKSTIVNLLLRYYEPQRGRILVNGEDVRQLPLDVLRALMAYVQQDIFLFAGDVLTNVRLSAPIGDEEVHRAAARVGADRVIDRLPGGWRHVLGERGAGVSVGERQLLAFARAIAADPSVLLLDEATRAVESRVEADIQEAVRALMRGRTTIAIAHRLSTITDADEILVLHHGAVIERGTHRSLLEAGGTYERLFRLQAGDEALANRPAAQGTRLPTDAAVG